MQVIQHTVVFIVVIEGQHVVESFAQQHSGLHGPATRDVSDGVAATAENKHWQVERSHVVHASLLPNTTNHNKLKVSPASTKAKGLANFAAVVQGRHEPHGLQGSG